MPNDKVDSPPLPALPVRSDNLRMAMYKNIAGVHKKMIEVVYQAKLTGRPPSVNAGVVLLHCEESIALLAEELLKLQAVFESELTGVLKESLDEALAMTEAVVEKNGKGG
jgi:hypothetical protein